MRSFLVFIFLLFCPLLALCDVYVDPVSGDDLNGGASGSPVKSISRAAQLMSGKQGTIHLLAGTHSVGSREVYLPTGVSLKGAGAASTTVSRFLYIRNSTQKILVDDITFLNGWIAVEYCTEAEFRGCEFNNSGRGSAYSVIVKNTDTTFSNCEFDRTMTYDYTGKSEGTGNVTFSSCTFKYTNHDPSVGFERIFSVLGCNNLIVQNCNLDGAGMDVETAVNVLISGNTLTNDSGCIFVTKCKTILIQSNTFRLPSSHLTISCEWAEIANITSNQVEGGSIYVSGGVTPETASASGNTCTEGGSIGGSMTISGNSFTDGQCGGSYSIVEGNTFTNCTVSAGYGIVRNNQFSNSRVSGTAGLVQGNSFSGVSSTNAIYGSAETVVTGNTIQGNGRWGVYYAGIVTNNNIQGFECGVYAGLTVLNNSIDCTGTGIEIAGWITSNVTIENNTIRGGTQDGISLSSAPNLICKGNTIDGPFAWGIHGGGNANEFSDNTIRNCVNGITGNPVGGSINGANREGIGVWGDPVSCSISGFDRGVQGRANKCNISDCNIGATRYDATNCTITDCDTGFQRDPTYSWLKPYIYDSTIRNCGLGADYPSACEIVSCVTGASYPVSCNISECSVGALQPSESIITNCDVGITGPANDNYVVDCAVGMNSTGHRNIIEGCDVGTWSITGGSNIFIGNRVGLEGSYNSSFGGTGYNLFQANNVAIKNVLGGVGAEKHNDFVGNSIAVLGESWGANPTSRKSLNYRYNYWNNSGGPTVNDGESHGDLIQAPATHFFIGYNPFDTAPNITEAIEYPETGSGEGVLRGILELNPTKGAPPLTVRAYCDVSGGVPPYSYAWSVDGTAATGNSASLSQSFDEEGVHVFEVIITDSESSAARAAGSVTLNSIYGVGSLTVVVNNEGSVLQGATVSVKQGEMAAAAGITDGNGRWTGSNLGVGSVSVTVDGPTVQAKTQSARITQGSNTQLTFDMKTLHAFDKKREIIEKLKDFPVSSEQKPLVAVENQAETFINSGADEDTVARLGLSELAAWSACGEAEMLTTGISASMGEVLGSILEAQQISAKLQSKALNKLPASLKDKADRLLKYVDGKLTGIFGQFVRFAVSSAPGTSGEKLRQDIEKATTEWINKKSSSGGGSLLADTIQESMLQAFSESIEGHLQQGVTAAGAGSFPNTLQQARADMVTHLSGVREDTMELANQLANAASLRGLSNGFKESAELAGSLLTYTGVGATFKPWVKAVENVSSALTTAADGYQVGAGAYRVFGELPATVETANQIVFGLSAKTELMEIQLPRVRMQSVASTAGLIDAATDYHLAIEIYLAKLNAEQPNQSIAWLEDGLLSADEELSRQLANASAILAAIMAEGNLSGDDLAELQDLSGQITGMGMVQGLGLLQSLTMAENLSLYLQGSYPTFRDDLIVYAQSARNMAGEVQQLAYSIDTFLAGVAEMPAVVAWGPVTTNPTVITTSPLDVEVVVDIVNLSDEAVSNLEVTLSPSSDDLTLQSAATVSIASLAAEGQADDRQACSWTLQYTGSVIGGAAVAQLSVTGPDVVVLPMPILAFLTAPTELDTDLDGLPDDYESSHSLNANDPSDAGADSDGDGLTTLEEYYAGTKAGVADTDGDGLKDGEEINTYYTDPLRADTDEGGAKDGTEVGAGLDPLFPDDDASITTPEPPQVEPTPTPDLGPPVNFAFQSEQLDYSEYFIAPTGLVTGDLSGDGDQDVIVMSVLGYQLVLFNDGAGNYTLLEMKGYNQDLTPRYTDACIANMDDDPEPEIVGILKAGTVVYQNIQEEPFITYVEPVKVQDITTGTKARALDTNGDGNNDMLVAYRTAQNGLMVQVLLGDGSGGFSEGTSSAFASTDNLTTLGTIYGMTVVDADGDGEEDVFLGDGDEGQFYRYDSQQQKLVYANSLFSDSLAGVRVREVYVEDLNLDGYLDLLMFVSVTDYSQANKQIRLYLGKSGGGWNLGQGSVLGEGFMRQIQPTGGLVLIDLDRDGDKDAVAFDCYDTSNRLVVMNNNTRGAVDPDPSYYGDEVEGALFSDVSYRVSGLAAYQSGTLEGLAVEDFNQDGALDLLLATNYELVQMFNITPVQEEPWRRIFSFAADWGRDTRVGPKVESDYNGSGEVETGDVFTLIRSCKD